MLLASTTPKTSPFISPYISPQETLHHLSSVAEKNEEISLSNEMHKIGVSGKFSLEEGDYEECHDESFVPVPSNRTVTFKEPQKSSSPEKLEFMLTAPSTDTLTEEGMSSTRFPTSGLKSLAPIPAAASDVWSLGCLVYELLTGNYLFEEQEEPCGFYLRLLGRTRLLPLEALKELHRYFPVPLSSFLHKVLDLEAAQRPTAHQLLFSIPSLLLETAFALSAVLPLYESHSKTSPSFFCGRKFISEEEKERARDERDESPSPRQSMTRSFTPCLPAKTELLSLSNLRLLGFLRRTSSCTSMRVPYRDDEETTSQPLSQLPAAKRHSSFSSTTMDEEDMSPRSPLVLPTVGREVLSYPVSSWPPILSIFRDVAVLGVSCEPREKIFLSSLRFFLPLTSSSVFSTVGVHVVDVRPISSAWRKTEVQDPAGAQLQLLGFECKRQVSLPPPQSLALMTDEKNCEEEIQEKIVIWLELFLSTFLSLLEEEHTTPVLLFDYFPPFSVLTDSFYPLHPGEEEEARDEVPNRSGSAVVAGIATVVMKICDIDPFRALGLLQSQLLLPPPPPLYLDALCRLYEKWKVSKHTPKKANDPDEHELTFSTSTVRIVAKEHVDNVQSNLRVEW